MLGIGKLAAGAEDYYLRITQRNRGLLGLFARKHRTAFGLAFGCFFFVGVEIAVLFSRQVAGSFYG
jgi:hypothetical protein